MTDTRPDIATSLFILPPDAKFVPVEELSGRLRAAIGPIEVGHSVLTRPGFRVTARLIPGPLAALLAEFRDPVLLTDGIVRFARAHDQDPFNTLEVAFDALASLVDARLLVPHDSHDAAAPVPGFASGQEFAGFEIETLIRSLEDSEVYRARGRGGVSVALKISRADRPDVAARISHEARTLDNLDGTDTPRLFDAGTARERSFIATSWWDGVSIAVAAQRMRASRDRRRVHALVSRMFDAYGRLHRQGVLHGDIHPGNCLVHDDGRVVLLDFGNAQSIVAASDVDPLRSGIPHFYDPQMADALLAGRLPPVVTPLSEQYALATMAYLLLTGVHPIVAPAVHDELLRRIVARPALPFAARGVCAWPEVEAVVVRGLAKQPDDRFPDVTALAGAFSTATLPTDHPPRWSDAARRALDDEISSVRRLVPSAGSFRNAWFAMRAAKVLEDVELLAAADIFARRAGSGWAAQFLSALVARTQSDSQSEDRAIVGFMNATDQPHDGPDACAAILAAAAMLEGYTTRPPYAALGEWATQKLDHLFLAPSSAWRGPGSAEAALAYAALVLGKTGAVSLKPDLQDRLEALTDEEADNLWLWALAYDVFAEARYKELARATKPMRSPLKRGLGLLRLHQLDGDVRWISKAHRVLAKAPNVRLPAADTALLMVELTAPEQAMLPPFVSPFRGVRFPNLSRFGRLNG